MKKLTNWIVTHKTLILIITAVLVILSAVCGMLFVKKNGDVISYLKDDTDTIIGKEFLSDKYGIVGDAQLAFTYLNKDQVGTIVERIENNSAVKRTDCKVVWVGTFDALDSLVSIFGDQFTSQNIKDINRIKDLSQDKFMATRTLTLNDGTTVEQTVYTVALYFSTAGSDDRTIDALNAIQAIIDNYVSRNVISSNSYPDNVLDIVNSIEKANSDESGKKYKPTTELTSENFYYIGGTSENARKLVDSSVNDMPKFMIAAVLAVLVILLISTQSYFEPLIFLATLGLSILFNMGTNVIAGNPVGTISTITSSCSSILQLAISMDFSIFLMHTYYEEKRIHLDSETAMRAALPKTIKSVASSALTTVGGFVALFFMQFGMGYDLGFVLAKGVILSLLAVMFIQPVLILICKKPIEKTQHKWRVTPRFKFITKTITKLPVAICVVVLCLGIAIPSAYYQTKVPLGYLTVTAENLNPNFAETVVSDENNQLIFMVPFDGSSEAIDSQFAFIEELKKIGVGDDKTNSVRVTKNYYNEEVYSVFSLFTLMTKDLFIKVTDPSFTGKSVLESRLLNSFVSKDADGNYEYMLYTVNFEGDPEDTETYNSLHAVRNLATERFGNVYITGLTQGAYELSGVTPTDFAVVNIVSAVIIFIILCITFKNPILSIILLLVIETGIFANLTLVTIIGEKINFMAYLIVSAIELGATVDYAIILTSKYREEKSRGVKGIQSIKNAIYRASPGLLTSAAVLITACISVKLLTSNLIVSQITELIARGTFFSLILVLTFLPAMLSLYERIIRKISIMRGKGDPDENKTEENLYGPSRKEKKAAKLAVAGNAGVIDNEEIADNIILSTADAIIENEQPTMSAEGEIIDNSAQSISSEDIFKADSVDNFSEETIVEVSETTVETADTQENKDSTFENTNEIVEDIKLDATEEVVQDTKPKKAKTQKPAKKRTTTAKKTATKKSTNKNKID